MADQKISQLTDGTSFQAGDEAVVNRSGTNFKVDPTQFGSSIDVTGTVTADGLTVDGQVQAKGVDATTGIRLDNGAQQHKWYLVDNFTNRWDIGTGSLGATYNFGSDNGTKTQLQITTNGDISFYEDTGTTPKFFWDASAESLGIGTSSPGAPLEILKTEDATIRLNYGNPGSSDGEDYYGGVEFYSTETSYGGPAVSAYIRAIHTRSGTGHNNPDAGLIFGTSDLPSSLPATERMRIESDTGRVGIGTSSPRQQLEVNGNIIADGIYLGGTGVANLLDDYEEGTFTLEIADAISGGNVSSTTGSGVYTKVGRQVTISFNASNISTSGLTSGNTVIFRGLPFISNGTYIGCALVDSITYSESICPIVAGANSYVFFREMPSGSLDADILVSGVSSGAADLTVTATYFTDS